MNMLFPSVWIQGNNMLSWAVGALVGVSTTIIILILSSQLLEENDCYIYSEKVFFEFACLDFIITCLKYWLEVRGTMYLLLFLWVPATLDSGRRKEASLTNL